MLQHDHTSLTTTTVYATQHKEPWVITLAQNLARMPLPSTLIASPRQSIQLSITYTESLDEIHNLSLLLSRALMKSTSNTFTQSYPSHCFPRETYRRSQHSSSLLETNRVSHFLLRIKKIGFDINLPCV